MASKREQVLVALFTVLSGVARPRVLRNETLPERVPPQGLLILRDGTPGESSVLISPTLHIYEHRAEVEVIVEAATPAERDAIFDGLMLAIGAAIDADRTLGGLCDYVETVAPEPVDLGGGGCTGPEGRGAAGHPALRHARSAGVIRSSKIGSSAIGPSPSACFGLS